MSTAALKWFDFKKKRKAKRARQSMLKEIEALKAKPQTMKRLERVSLLQSLLEGNKE